jgi:hypothetical protein
MLHNGNMINGHRRSEESIRLIREHLVHHHDDGDNDSLFVRFNEILQRVESLECSLDATWKTLTKETK